ncbi:polyprenol monophosphomannose synthase [Amnibacterium kyonggiense]
MGLEDPGAGGVLVCIPTYDEAENVEDIVSRVLAARPDVHVLVVDDNSPDGTGAIADAFAARDERVHVLHRRAKNGLGAAYLEAFAWGVDRGYGVLVEMDADGSHRPEDLGALLDAVRDGADLALGSRWVAGGRVVNWPKRRELLSRGGSAWSRLMIGTRVRDVTGGFRAFRASRLPALHLESVASAGYCFQVDLLRRAVRAGFDIREEPIVFVERERGASKMTGNIVVEALWRTTVWGIEDRVRGTRR